MTRIKCEWGPVYPNYKIGGGRFLEDSDWTTLNIAAIENHQMKASNENTKRNAWSLLQK